jgi:hypothetical protein
MAFFDLSTILAGPMESRLSNEAGGEDFQYATTVSVRTLILAAGMTLVTATVNAQSSPPNGSVQLPKFGDYQVTEIFKGPPAPPQLRRPADRLFRTKIREGAAKGPNFAGHYTIADWGCGAGCVSIAIVDAKDGRIHDAPFTALEWGMPLLKYEGKYAPNLDGFEPLQYKLESRLLIARGCPEEENCASYFYEWTGSKFKLIRKVAALSVQK